MPKRKADSRFCEMTDEAVDQVREDVQKKNTLKSDKNANKLFIEYLKQRWSEEVENDFNYWKYDPSLLDKILEKFWFETRQQNGERYTVNSLQNLRYAINRNLKKRGAEFDITKTELFAKSQQAFEDACRLLKKLGFGNAKHYDEIKPAGL